MRRKPLILAKLHCTDSLTITGRNRDGSPDLCFQEGKEYLFCVDQKDIFTVNEVGEVHFFELHHPFMEAHFEVHHIDEAEFFGLDDVTFARYKRLYKQRRQFQE